MKAYTLLLDALIMSLLVLAVLFQLSDDVITTSHVSRAGLTRTTIISWHSLLMFASFCVILRYIAGKAIEVPESDDL